MPAKNEVCAATELIEQLKGEDQPFGLSLIARRCIDALAELGTSPARQQLRNVTDFALATERATFKDPTHA